MVQNSPQNLDLMFLVAQERAEKFMHDVIYPAREELMTTHVIDLDKQIAEIVG